MATVPKFRIDVDIHNLLMRSAPEATKPAAVMGVTLPEPPFPQYPENLAAPGQATPPDKREWSLPLVYRSMRGWLVPYVRSRLLPGDFTPSRPICSSSTNAISTAGIAGLTTTK